MKNKEGAMQENQGTYYGDYLQLDQLLSSQKTISGNFGEGKTAHDETLFIIVHQVYELWFKQMVHELNDMLSIFGGDHIPESTLARALDRIERIKKIQSLLNPQLDVMESMTPMDFLEFRDLLMPASGFQSVQFRELEIKLGLTFKRRKGVEREYFMGRLNNKDRLTLEEIEKSPSLSDLIESWLERMPFTSNENFTFWKEYQSSVQTMLKDEESIIKKNNAGLSQKQQMIQLENLNVTKETFEYLMDEEKYNEVLKKGKKFFSREATLNALFILLYRDQPLLQLPYRIITGLIDIDENFTTWRYRHALMAHRMLGTKIGTGGSSGHHYLKMAAEHNRVFTDLFDLSTFLLPRSRIPKLPKELSDLLQFSFEEKAKKNV